MRSLLIGLAVTCAIWSLPEVVQAQDVHHEMIEVVFTPTTLEGELLAVQDRLKAQDIELTYTDVRYEHGKLVFLAFAVKTTTGNGTASGDIAEGKRFGFRSDPRPGAVVQFMVGTLPDPGTEMPTAK
jgi:hypothetical protein